MKKIVIVAFLVFTASFGLVASASSAPTPSVTSAEVSTSIDDSQTSEEIEELKAIISELNDDNVQLKVENAVLKNSNETLKKVISYMNDDNADLKKEIGILQDSVVDLKVENAVLATKNEFLNTTIAELLIERGNLEYEVETLKEQLNRKKYQRVAITNSWWEYCYDRTARTGTIGFDDLSIVDTITVSFRDNMFNDISNEVMSDWYMDQAQNTLTVTVDISAPICELEIFYKDGRSETITHKIIMG